MQFKGKEFVRLETNLFDEIVLDGNVIEPTMGIFGGDKFLGRGISVVILHTDNVQPKETHDYLFFGEFPNSTEKSMQLLLGDKRARVNNSIIGLWVCLFEKYYDKTV